MASHADSTISIIQLLLLLDTTAYKFLSVSLSWYVWRLLQSENLQLCNSFTGRMPFLLPNQQCQSTEGN